MESSVLANFVWKAFSGRQRPAANETRLGQYTLERKLGQGGMGVVYEARHPMLERRTAIKLLPAELAGEEALARFEREVQVTARLSHPNIVPVYDFGRSSDGSFYYAMEYLDGVDLERLVAECGPQPASRVAYILWPDSGVPDKPGAWLMATAKHHAINLLRRRKLLERKHAELGHEIEDRRQMARSDLEDAIDDDIGDDLLRLVFTCCHPVLPIEARIALTLRLLGGLTTEEIARAFLVPEATVAQRIVRAKRTLADQQIPFEVPRGADLAPRLSAVLGVMYLVFNEGHSATVGDDWVRPALCEDALRLGRILAGLAPEEPEVHGLVALMEIQASRLAARVGPSGEPILLLDQDRSRWDHLLIARGLAALARAEALGGPRASYTLQAALAACHARARTAEETDWARIVTLYEELARLAPSPVVELNRAVAVSMAEGPLAGLALVDALTSERSLAGYHLLPSVRADLLFKLGRLEEAKAEFERAAALARNARERDLLLSRAASCSSS